jgi:hypothetical protein
MRELIRPGNVAGLISGNFKRHLKFRHNVFADNAFGTEVINLSVDGCVVCKQHADALLSELKRIGA